MRVYRITQDSPFTSRSGRFALLKTRISYLFAFPFLQWGRYQGQSGPFFILAQTSMRATVTASPLSQILSLLVQSHRPSSTAHMPRSFHCPAFNDCPPAAALILPAKPHTVKPSLVTPQSWGQFRISDKQRSFHPYSLEDLDRQATRKLEYPTSSVIRSEMENARDLRITSKVPPW